MIFRILLSKSESHEAAVELHAESADEAEEIARQRAEDGLVAWTRTHEELRAEVER